MNSFNVTNINTQHNKISLKIYIKWGVVTIQQAKKDIKSQRKIVKLNKFLYFSFKVMTIIASYCFFIHMNVKEFKQKFI